MYPFFIGLGMTIWGIIPMNRKKLSIFGETYHGRDPLWIVLGILIVAAAIVR
jgi:hypothetical protein